jgi:hypothetical protein
MRKGKEEEDSELYTALRGVFTNPNLPAHMYITNFNCLVDTGGYIDKHIQMLTDKKSPYDLKVKLHSLSKFDTESKASGFKRMAEKHKDDNKTVEFIPYPERVMET